MGVGAGLYMYDVVVKSSRSLSHLLINFLLSEADIQADVLLRTGRIPARPWYSARPI